MISRRRLITGGAALAAFSSLPAYGGVINAGARRTLRRPAPAGFSNFNPGNTARMRARLQQIMAGTAHYYLMCLGDSQTAAHGAGSGVEGDTGARIKAWPKLLARDLTNELGLQAECCAHMHGAGYTYAEFSANGYDGQFDFSGTTTWTGPSQSTCGVILTNNNAGTDPLVWTPEIPVNKIALAYLQNTGYATFTPKIDGDAEPDINAAGSSSVQRVEFDAGELGTHEFSIERTGVGTILGVGMLDAYNDTIKKLRVVNMGRLGASIRASYTTTTNPWSSKTFIDYLVANLPIAGWIIFLCHNDWSIVGNTDYSTFIANGRALLDQIKPYQDVIWIIGAPQGPNIATQAKMTEIKGGVHQLSREYDFGVIDPAAKFIDYTTANSRGLMFDQGHFNAAGQIEFTQLPKLAVKYALNGHW